MCTSSVVRRYLLVENLTCCFVSTPLPSVNTHTACKQGDQVPYKRPWLSAAESPTLFSIPASFSLLLPAGLAFNPLLVAFENSVLLTPTYIFRSRCDVKLLGFSGGSFLFQQCRSSFLLKGFPSVLNVLRGLAITADGNG
jgi:hypothetical protein